MAAQRSRASCSTLVGRPGGRRAGGGSAGRLAWIHASTSCSNQHRRREPGSLKGRGMRCWYFLLVAQVRIVVAVLPITGDNCSMKRIRGKVGDSGKRAASAAQANGSGTGHPRGNDGFLDKVSHGSDIVECFGQLQ